jgi:hypothetical protein
MANTVKIKNSGNANSVPSSLEYGELAINYNDKVLYYKTSSNAIVSFDLTTSMGDLELDVTDLQVEIAMQICG